MHDLHLANQIVKIAKENTGDKKIKSVSVKLGDVLEHGENITPENLKYNINLLLPDTRVNIKKIKGNFWKITKIQI